MKVLAFGEVLFDVIEGHPHLGGAPLNFAAHLARFGVDSFILSRVGEDVLGNEALSRIGKLGVNTTLVQLDGEHPTGTVEVNLSNGQPDYTIPEGVAYDFIQPVDKEEVHEIGFDVLYFGTLAQRNEQSRGALASLISGNHFRHIFYDANLRKGFYTRDILLNSLRSCTILKLNDEEEVVLGNILFQEELSLEGFSVRVEEEFGIHTTVITAGAEGCMVHHEGNQHSVKGYPAKVVDTVGAGDSFSAAFLHQFLRHNDPVRAADIANQLGAYVASSRGPIPEYSPEIKKVLGIGDGRGEI